MKRGVTIIACLLQSSVALSAQYLLQAGHMIDVIGGKTLSEVTITVDGNRITAVDPGYTAPGEGQVVVDLDDYTVMRLLRHRPALGRSGSRTNWMPWFKPRRITT